MKKIILILFCIVAFTDVQAQFGFRLARSFAAGSFCVGKGNDKYADTCAWFDFADSTKRAFRLPAVVDVDSIYLPKAGLLAWEIPTATIQLYNGSSWVNVLGGGGGGAVSSVNSLTGAVSLGIEDILSEDHTSNGYDLNMLDISGNRVFQVNNTLKTLEMGDPDGSGFGTLIAIDDPTQTIMLDAQSIKIIGFDDNQINIGGNTGMTQLPSGSFGQYLFSLGSGTPPQWTNLPTLTFGSSLSGGSYNGSGFVTVNVSDADKGDITVATSGTAWSIDNGVVGNAKLTNSTISGVALGSNLNTLTFTTPFTGGSYNGSAGVSIGLAGLSTLGGSNQVLGMNNAASAYEYKTVQGTSNRITVTHGANSISYDIAATYVGQTSLTTVGTIGTGTWNASVIAGQFGGTGVANTGKTITVSGNTVIGSSTHTVTFTTSGNTNIAFPTSGTAATLAGVEVLTNKTLTNPSIANINNGGTIAIPTVTGTLIQKAESASTSSGTPAGDAIHNYYDITAVSAILTMQAPSGTPANHSELVIRIKDNGSPRPLVWNAIYRAGTTVALPASTVANRTMYVKFIYNSTDVKWDLIDVLNGF